MAKQTVLNPWGLTCAEVDVADSLRKHGHIGSVARELNRSQHTVAHQAGEVYRKMDVPRMAVATAKWAVWRATDGKGVPA